MVSKPPVTLDPEFEASDDSEDEDYDPTNNSIAKNHGDGKNDDNDDDDSGEEDQLGDYDSGDEKTIGKQIHGKRKRTKPAPEEEQEVIKTRSQRNQETASAQAAAPEKGTANVNDLWSAMNAPKTKKATHAEEETIEIDRTYTFAGEVHTERKTVPKQSQEAKDYLANLQSKNQGSHTSTLAADSDSTTTRVNGTGKPLRKVFKRKSTLGDPKPKKLNTLEKSRMEWSGFVDREGINEDLKRGNQAGYLDKVDFLRQSEAKMHDRHKAAGR